MSRFVRFLFALAITVGLALYLVYVGLVAGTRPSDVSARALLSLAAATVLLVIGWGRMLHAASKAGSQRRRLFLSLAVVGIVGFLALAGLTPGVGVVALPAFFVTAVVTVCVLLRSWRLLLVLFAAPLAIEGWGYFGAVLIAIGVFAAPSAFGPWFRDLCPRRVGDQR